MTPAPASAAEPVVREWSKMALSVRAGEYVPVSVYEDGTQGNGNARDEHNAAINHLRAQLAEAQRNNLESLQELGRIRRERGTAEARATAAEAELAEAQNQRHAFALELRIVQDTLFAKLDALKASEASRAAMREAAAAFEADLSTDCDGPLRDALRALLSAGAQPGEDR